MHAMEVPPGELLSTIRAAITNKKYEKFAVFALNLKNEVTEWKIVATGSSSHVSVPVREIFLVALQNGGRRYAVAHNHPSGDPAPSTEDVHLTDRLLMASSAIGITLVDHIIIGSNGLMHSFAMADGWTRR